MAETKIYKESKEYDLTNAEIQKLHEVGNGMTNKEKAEIIKTFPVGILLNEIKRRDSIVENIYGQILAEMQTVTEESTHRDVQGVLLRIKEILRA